MTNPFLGEVQIFGFNFAPYQWALCNGQTLPINQNSALYALIGVNYGGNGQTSFMLPNLVSRAADSQGTGPGLTRRSIGQSFGENGVTLSTPEIPAHVHPMSAYSGGSGRAGTPTVGAGLTSTNRAAVYAAAGTTADTMMSPIAVAPTGGGAPHENRQPFLAINFSIALAGVFPSFG